MTTPTVTELTRPLEPIGHDTFADEARGAAAPNRVPARSARAARVASTVSRQRDVPPAPAAVLTARGPRVGARAA